MFLKFMVLHSFFPPSSALAVAKELSEHLWEIVTSATDICVGFLVGSQPECLQLFVDRACHRGELSFRRQQDADIRPREVLRINVQDLSAINLLTIEDLRGLSICPQTEAVLKGGGVPFEVGDLAIEFVRESKGDSSVFLVSRTCNPAWRPNGAPSHLSALFLWRES
uniref:Uncharacterized protein n=1 Tax=Chromera velia CCMP2878 TaxID=1169474 RepID=A0A0G4HC07_9ALVE|eukprot:Cvel_26118.t1-p1 / transcript=Cvel_26118.t1 / gene=Cvel_26118 / organism=Chromera_velia_CCMP2878 / gene_product=hypothetical protein / transcript_product=hypothetical protein / location=Cvel_scaffold3056:10907-11404(+) / protein_length=166 / sequence_SO=supercontig / SO=protein_coding / is_pseudo=false